MEGVPKIVQFGSRQASLPGGEGRSRPAVACRNSIMVTELFIYERRIL